jgi:hypothetical protein
MEESRWNVASKLASLLHGEIRNNGVPAFVAEAALEEVLGIELLVELARDPKPACGDS